MNRCKLTASLLVAISALSIAALSCGMAANLPNPFASATPTATATFTPTLTPTITPSPTSTPTATPVPTGIVINAVADGANQVLDYDGGYILDLPSDWLPTKIGQEDIQLALSKLGNTDPSLSNIVKAAEQAQPGMFRIIAFDKNPAHSTKGYVTNLNVVMMKDAVVAAMPLDTVIKVTLEQVKAQVPSAKIKQLDTTTNAHGIPVAGAELQMSIRLPSGAITLYEKQLYFQTKSGLVIITLSTTTGSAAAAKPAFDPLLDGIQLMEQ